MPGYQTPSYRRIQDASKRMHSIVLNEDDNVCSIQAAKTLLELEAYKAELRGKPRIKPCELKDAPAARKRVKGPPGIKDAANRQPAAKEAPKESLSNPRPSPPPPPAIGESGAER